ncbi:MAG TPA: class I SAM-dependent methyltransferase [Terriglobales bacterium]|nr:class I SAM-dependent methyltransferase [Terriglobales bacterium]
MSSEQHVQEVKEQVNELFTKTVDDWARFYEDPKPATLTAQNLVSRRRFTLEMVESRLAPGSKILDVGCGTGHLAGALMQRGYDAWGVDFSEGMVQYAAVHYRADRFQVGDIERIPFPDNTFDGIVCLGVMEYLSSDEKALREMWRVLKPGGVAIITTPNALCPFWYCDRGLLKARILARPLVRLVRRSLTAAKDLPTVTHRRFFPGHWAKLMRSVGLKTEEVVCHAWGWYSLERFFPQGGFCRASDRFARNRAINWFASDQLSCVRAIK